MGGWGDPSQDIRVQTGGFSDFPLAYPVYHSAVRRNFTLQPWIPLDGSPLWPSPTGYTIVNTTFTPANVSAMVDGFRGDFKGMQRCKSRFRCKRVLAQLTKGRYGVLGRTPRLVTNYALGSLFTHISIGGVHFIVGG